MSNIVSFPTVPAPRPDNGHDAPAALIASFASQRRAPDDVFWLKENAEVLNILAATDTSVSGADLAPLVPFYDALPQRLQFYPQYYRFLISMCLDLETLGLKGDLGEQLCQQIAQMGLAEAELSDLQRAEAQRLLARRGAAPTLGDDPLADRLRSFISRPATFAMPNKKAAYELTHIVFYLADYGRCDPQLDAQARRSLEYTGLMAYLDQNMDLLAEVVVAMGFAGMDPSMIWTDAVTHTHDTITTYDDDTAPLMDAYHLYLVSGWAKVRAGQGGLAPLDATGSMRFYATPPNPSALRPLSECLFDMGSARTSDWAKMRGHVLPYLGSDGHAVLYRAEKSSACFGEFFEGFARAATP